MKKITLNLLKILFVFSLFYYLSKKDLISWNSFQSGLKNYPYSLTGFFILVLCSLISVIRWNLLLRALSIHLPFSRVLQFHLIGNFFNIALPGAVSGDIIKAFYIAKESPGNRATALGSILVDRIVGLSALVFVSVGALGALWAESVLPASDLTLSSMSSLVILLCILVLLFYIFLFSVKEGLDPILWACIRLERLSHHFGSLTRTYQGVRAYQGQKKTILISLALSVVVHLGAGLACFLFLKSISDAPLSLSFIYFVVPIGLLVTAIPIFPGGVGTGHAAFGFFFKTIHFLKGADVFSLYVLCQFIIGGLGGLVYLKFKSKNLGLSASFSHPPPP